MAYKEVELSEEEMKSAGAAYVQFKAIGDKLIGRFLGTQPTTGKYAKAGENDYRFKTVNEKKEVVEVLLTPATNCRMKLEKAEKNGELRIGSKVLISFDSEQDIGKQSPLKIFKVAIDNSPPPAGAVAPKPPPPPPPPAADDIDF